MSPKSFDLAPMVIQVRPDGGFDADPDMEIVLFGHINLLAGDFVP